jgi:hypothetical protein
MARFGEGVPEMSEPEAVAVVLAPIVDQPAVALRALLRRTT